MESEIGLEDDIVDPSEEPSEDASDGVAERPLPPFPSAGWTFYAAVRALAAARPDLPGVGRSTRIEQDGIHFRQEPSLRMEPTEIFSITEVETPDGPVAELTQVFFGPFGANGALPDHVTEDAIDAERMRYEGATDLRDFTDLFTHRMTALLYRAWETTQIAVNRDRGDDDLYLVWIGALFGQGPAEFRDRDAMPDDVKRYMAGWMSNPRGSVAAIEAVLAGLTGVRMRVAEFRPEWLDIPAGAQARLGEAPAGLGRDIVIGSRFHSMQTRLRIRTDRLSLAKFHALLPDGTHFQALRDAMRNVLGLDLAWELQLVLDGQEVPRLTLDGSRRLGWDSWAIEENRFSDVDDVVLEGTFRTPPPRPTRMQRT